MSANSAGETRKFKVITLCGSSRFKKDFIESAEKLSLEGNIVISLGLFGNANHKYDTVITDKIKKMLDEVHKEKIKMSDAIYVINPNGYIGESTKNEIKFAREHNKEIIYKYPNYNSCTFKGTNMSLKSLQGLVVWGVLTPNHGDIYCVREARGCRDLNNNMVEDMGFVVYNSIFENFERINMDDAKIKIKI